MRHEERIMQNTLCLMFFIAWYIFGVWSFIYWWRKKDDFTVDEVVVALLAGIVGPVSFIIGWGFNIDSWCGKKVLFKRKGGHET